MTSPRIALFENIHSQAVDLLRHAGFEDITAFSGALEGETLVSVLEKADIVGIRSKSQLTDDILRRVPHLRAVGCFCIGTDQVDLDMAQELGIPVFNAPYANTRSVAELMIGEIIILMRGIVDKSVAAHAGKWLKSATGSSEVRGKTLGIIGYGHIGSQVSVLAESLGMRVVFYDIADKLVLGNASRAPDMRTVLEQADVVSLHVPAGVQTENLITATELKTMKQGAFLLNASRGSVVDLDALSDALRSGHVAGAAIDVFPVEPSKAGDAFVSPLQNIPNVILTPHIGGSTIEAQENIALDVAEKLVRFAMHGSTGGAVNVPQVTLPDQAGPDQKGMMRFVHMHRNRPGTLARINDVFSSRGINIVAQYLQTNAQSGYVVIDTENVRDADDVRAALRAIEGTIRSF